MDQQLVLELENLFEKDYSKLYAYAFRMVGDHHDAEDCVQNALLNAYNHLHQFRGESKLSTWVHRILINACSKHFEKLKKLPVQRITEERACDEASFFGDIIYEAGIDDGLIMEEMREQCLQAFLKCLPQKQRIVFLLSANLKLPQEDIALAMDMTTSNVKVTLYRARKKLQELLNMRCSLIDPQKPCRCHLWIQYMRDHGLSFDPKYLQYKNDALKSIHFQNLSILKKINFLYGVNSPVDKSILIKQLKENIQQLH